MELIGSTFKRKNYWIFNAAVFFCLAILMVFFSFVDLNLSKKVYDNASWFGKLFRAVGEIPAWLIAPLFFTVCFYKFKNLGVVNAVFLFLIAFSNYFWLNKILSTFNMPTWAYWLLMVIFAIGFAFLFLSLFHNFKTQSINKLLYVFSIGAIFVLMNTAAVQLIKLFWGRIRFRDLVGTDFRDFTHWFIPRGITGNKSFPSGHTASACAMLILLLICHQFKLSTVKNVLMALLVILFILFTAISRVILGAHYATDVTFAIIISYALFLFSIFIVDKIYSHLIA